MYILYILYSAEFNKYYIGTTANLDERIKKHLTNHKGFTGSKNDWELKYSENHNSKEEGLNRERQIKNWKSRKMIEKLIGSAGSAHPDL